MKVNIITDGTNHGTHITNADTGEELQASSLQMLFVAEQPPHIVLELPALASSIEVSNAPAEVKIYDPKQKHLRGVRSITWDDGTTTEMQ